jgi:hypothetical protein
MIDSELRTGLSPVTRLRESCCILYFLTYGTFGMQRLIFSAKYRVLVRGGCSIPKIRSGIRIQAQKQAEFSG